MNSCPFYIDEWLVEPGLNRISRDGRQEILQPLIMRLLVILSLQPGKLVSKEDLICELWPRTIVTDNALTRAFSQLRCKLGDDVRNPRFISTVVTKGYCLVAEVRRLATSGSAKTVAQSVSAREHAESGFVWQVPYGSYSSLWMRSKPGSFQASGRLKFRG